MQVRLEMCTGCGFCMRDCPVEAVKIIKRKAVIDRNLCTNCGVCLRVCGEKAIAAEESHLPGSVECDACPIKCRIPLNGSGACLRYKNKEGTLIRAVSLHTYGDVEKIVGKFPDEAIMHPVITGIGAGTTYPDCRPAPYIVNDKRNDIDVVTVVTEVPLSYSSIIVKIDTDIFIGREGALVYVGKRVVGMVETEQYGSKMLHIGGVNRLTGENGFLVARTITDIANGKPFKLKIENGSRLKLQVGRPPVIDGRVAEKMRVGCGSATLGIFAPMLMDVCDEAVILDSHVTGLMSRHVAGAFVGVKPTGVALKFRQSTPGRYFGDHGNGWGGTSIKNPEDIIDSIDMNVAWPGMRILITETTGQKGAMFELDDKGNIRDIPMTDKAAFVLASIEGSCEPSLVSAIYTAGSGGSARAGVTKYPVKLTRAVHENKAHLTVGGVPGYVLPGGGITFMVDVQRIKPGAFYWTPTPATICPLEYTMKLEDYKAMGGHIEAMKPFSASVPAKDDNVDDTA